MNKIHDTINTPHIDPRTVLIIVFLCTFTGLSVNKPISSHLLLCICVLYALSAKAYKECMMYSFIYIVIAVLMYGIAYIPNTNLMLMIVSLSYIAQKFIIMMIMAAFLKKRTSLPYIISAMQVVKCPNAVAIPFIVLLRYIPTVTEDYRCLKDSLKIRGISVSAVQFFIHPIRTLEFLIVPILLRSVRVAEELSASLLLRGIEAFKDRTNLYPLQFKTIDYVYICSALVSAVVIGML